jgi:hypothetical protein
MSFSKRFLRPHLPYTCSKTREQGGPRFFAQGAPFAKARWFYLALAHLFKSEFVFRVSFKTPVNTNSHFLKT